MTREKALKNAEDWVDKKVMYSQSRYYEGYRQDCSGFVSMILELNTSYTTRNLDTVLKRIEIDDLQCGDAVLTPGHVVLFIKWEEKCKSFLCAEESSSGHPARYKVKTLRNAKAYSLATITTEAELKKIKSEKEFKEASMLKQDYTIAILKFNTAIYGDALFTPTEILELNNLNM